MLKLLFFVILASVLVNKVNGQTAEEKKFAPEKLSSKGKIAYEKLLKTNEFYEPLISEGEDLAENIKSFNVLFDEKIADEANKSLLNEANMVGQLYALCAIYYTDHEFFKIVVEKYKVSEIFVERRVGEMRFMGKVSKIVESSKPNVAIIPPNETLQDWWNKNTEKYQVDIIRGGFPASFRHLKDYKN